ncbi:amidase : Amidase, Asp-tRNAAsn/Glu-tRNAGln amidotransferase A subunit OS=Singulisphaera acidiphila (strain ATCC BAA-1392 / DSM 18658 / VKM B-2454 / MOB10) GN=Sinac_6930 PE=4 SV=1: Amidase [Gemmata massiliana]|uniref:Amidase domain-containing protein n=1 Tax=Gemmata massiliana TaxID=1210884 RepID=A0A6P2DKK3_9BACT|nr:amidase [Gemmata massiliana]VTS02112.1 amidase : Amidase, Asp-tRNAAsn/Glu-tRNAGln amidotransferase A subunit OS=Singulisphaera acidiphila (strain ATCC BAA-1392 / DSM 18658 / VKM B-2454 / MOB10) GN=Sinac_6930 PE=4 SV=1: Amidase [Gemmata massiliana]
MSPDVSRRDLFAAVAAVGVGNATFQRAVAATAAQPKVEAVTAEMVQGAEWVAGITLTEAERKTVAGALTNTLRSVAAFNKLDLGNSVPPAVYFNAVPWEGPNKDGRGKTELRPQRGAPKKPGTDDDLAFQPLAVLAELIRLKQITSTDLTKVYLARLKKYDPALLCVVSLTEELALKQAAEADKEIAAGKYRGPLHGIPWAAKDLIAYPGYPTTWGAGHFQEQKLGEKATVAARLDDAGAVLACKSTLGSLAWGDIWFGGTTRNPWNIKQGSSGSSAGTASSVAAGLVGFGLGSETLGSIVSPSTRCGVTGLRPTFGRVSRHGCMALCWSLDKIGPMCRSAEDCALVFGAIHGFDGKDATAQDRPFHWPAQVNLKELNVGFVEGNLSETDQKVLKELGVKMVPIKLPQQTAGQIVGMILDVEAAAAFDDITREGVKEGIGLWPSTFRRGRFVSAVDYLKAQRARTLLMHEMAKVMEKVDLYVGGNDLSITNLTGHPTVCLPNGFRGNSPTALTFTGRLFGESALLAVAKAYQDATGHHLKRPPQDSWVVEKKDKKE